MFVDKIIVQINSVQFEKRKCTFSRENIVVYNQNLLDDLMNGR